MTQMIEIQDLLTIRTVTATGNSPAEPIDISRYTSMYAEVIGVKVSGTSPTLTPFISQLTSSGSQNALVTMAIQNASFKLVVNVPLTLGKLFAEWVIGGTDTPTWTFRVILTGRIN